MANKLAKQFMSYAMGSFAVLILGFISSPIITRLISPGEYGKMSMFNMIVTVFGMVSILGLDQSYIRFYNKNGVDKETLFKQCRALPFLFTGIVVAVYILFARPINQLLFNTHSLLVMILVILCIICTVTNRFEFLYVRMHQEGKVYSFVQICQKLSYIVAFIAFFWILGDRFEVAIAAISCSMLLATGLLFFRRVKRTAAEMKISRRDTISNKQLFLFGLPFVANSMLSWLMISADKISIKMWASDIAELGYYSAAATIIVLITTLKDVFSTFYAPVALQSYERDPDNTEFFRSFCELLSSVCFLLGIIFIMSKDIIVLLLGEQYRSASKIMPCLLFVPIMHMLAEITSQGINFKNKPILHNFIEIPVCILNFLLNYLLIPYIGARGAAIASGLSYIVFFFGKTIVSEKCYPVGYRKTNICLQVMFFGIYALLATFIENVMLLTLVGLLLCTLLILLNMSTYKKIIGRLGLKEKLITYKRILSNDVWNVAISDDSPDDVIKNQGLTVHWVKHSYRDRFFADPFLLRQDASYYYIIAEEYKFWAPKGIIVLLQVSKKSYSLEKRMELIVEDAHLSFPFVINENIIIPECYRSGLTKAYEVDEHFHIRNVSLFFPYGTIDGVYLKRGEKEYYVFSQSENALSEVYLAEKNQNEDIWKSSTLYPVKSDIRTARSAGHMFYCQGKLIRPVQDSEKCYGHQVRLMEVKKIGEGTLVEKEIACLSIRNKKKYQKGFHTFNVYDNCIIVDGCQERFQPLLNICIIKCREKTANFFKRKYRE